MSERYSVWTKDTSDSWAARNAGCTDRLVVFNVPEQQAQVTKAVLADLYGDTNVETHPADRPPVAGSVGTNT
jgi:hypothetical protein